MYENMFTQRNRILKAKPKTNISDTMFHLKVFSEIKKKKKKRGGGGHMGERTTIPTKGDDKICFSYWSSVR